MNVDWFKTELRKLQKIHIAIHSAILRVGIQICHPTFNTAVYSGQDSKLLLE